MADIPEPYRSTAAQDAAYTINHALACTGADLASPFIGHWTQKYLGRRIEVGCGHDHASPLAGLRSSPGADTPEGSYKRMRPVGKMGGLAGLHAAPPAPQSRLRHWWLGELAGDFGAVPVTIGLQRFAPGFMKGIGSLLEPLFLPVFRFGARRAATRWAAQQEQLVTPEALAAKQREILSAELHHLPQALIWTASAMAINLGVQRMAGNKGPLSHMLAGKLAGSGFSTALVVGLRAGAPGAAQRWDGFTAERIFTPIEKTLTGTWQAREESTAQAAAAPAR